MTTFLCTAAELGEWLPSMIFHMLCIYFVGFIWNQETQPFITPLPQGTPPKPRRDVQKGTGPGWALSSRPARPNAFFIFFYFIFYRVVRTRVGG